VFFLVSLHHENSTQDLMFLMLLLVKRRRRSFWSAMLRQLGISRMKPVRKLKMDSAKMAMSLHLVSVATPLTNFAN